MEMSPGEEKQKPGGSPRVKSVRRVSQGDSGRKIKGREQERQGWPR